MERHENEVSRTSEAQRMLGAQTASQTSKESSPTPVLPLLTAENTDQQKIVYAITNLSAQKPRFGGHDWRSNDKEVHPIAFLEVLTSYLKKLPTQGSEIDIVQECQTGEARNWSRIYRERWVTYDDFKRDFLKTFWSEVDQFKVRRDIVSNQWDQKENPTMLSHFLSSRVKRSY